MSEVLLAGVLRAIAGILSASLAYLIGHAAWLWIGRRTRGPQLARARAELARLMMEPDPARAPLGAMAALPMALRLRLVMEPARSLRGAARDTLREVAGRIGVIDAAHRLLGSPFWWRRLRGGRILAALGVGGEAPLRMLADRHPAVRAQAAEWAGDHPSREMAEALVGLLADPATLCRFAVQDSLLRLGTVSVAPLVGHLSARSGRGDLLALRVAVEMAQPAFGEPAIALCRDADPRVRACAAGLLGAVGGRAAVEALRPLMSDASPEVREAAVRALGRMGHWPAAAEASRLLRDPEWEVRRAGALALHAMGEPGILLLRHFRDDADRFAADMARQVLQLPRGAEGGIA